MNILALDIATKTGWACLFNGYKQTGVNSFALKRGESPGMRFLRFRAWLREIYKLLEEEIDIMVYERAHHRGGAATEVCVGMVTEAQAFAADNQIELMPVATTSLKKFATGKGNANKQAMIKAAISMGYNPIDDNEADAALLLEYGIDELKVTC